MVTGSEQKNSLNELKSGNGRLVWYDQSYIKSLTIQLFIPKFSEYHTSLTSTASDHVYTFMVLRRLLSRKDRRIIKQELKVKEKHNLEIRDSLAMERTKLANERTFLSYIRSALGLVLAGLTFMKVFDDPAYIAMGLVSIPVGIGVGYFGYYRFSKKKAEITRYTHEYVPTSPVLAEVNAQENQNPTE